MKRRHSTWFDAHGRPTQGRARPDAGKIRMLGLARRPHHPLSPLAVAKYGLTVPFQPCFARPVLARIVEYVLNSSYALSLGTL